MNIPGLSPWWLIISLLIVVVPMWRITSRAGFPAVLSLLVIVPVANLIFLWVLAFAEWPAEQLRSTPIAGPGEEEE